MQKLKIIIAEDHVTYRNAIVSLLNSDGRFEVIGETESGDTILLLTSPLSPDFILMDIVLEDKNGIEASRDIKQRFPQVKVIGLSLYDDEHQQNRMLEVGASAFLTKKCCIEEIKSTIVRVKHGY